MFTQLLQDKKIIILLGVSIFLAIILITSSFFLLKESTPEQSTIPPTPTPYTSLSDALQNDKYVPNQKTTITKTTTRDIEARSDIEKKVELPNDITKYIFTSPFKTRKNEAITEKDKVIFERILVPEKQSDPGFVRFSEYKTLLGEPQESIQGSKFYGKLIHALIYADKGLTLIGNTFTDEVYEVQVYEPMTVTEYLQKYGEDIDETSKGFIPR